MTFPNLNNFNTSRPQPANSQPSKPLESVLVADCGSNTTRVVLIDVVDMAYRFIARAEAPSTLEPPYADVTIGILNAIAAIEANTGRRLLIGGQLITPMQENGSGVDAFVASSSAADALRVLAAGLVRQLSVKTVARASHGTYTTVLDTMSLDDYGDDFDESRPQSETTYDPNDPDAEFSPFTSPEVTAEEESNRRKNKKGSLRLFGNRPHKYWRERQVAKLRRLSPNVIVLSGGKGEVIEPLLQLIDVVLEANRQEMLLASATGEIRRPPTLVFAGNTEAQEAIIQRVAGQVEFFAIDNIRPGGVLENLYPLQHQLAALYQERLLPTLPGYDRLANLCSAEINTTCSAVGLMTQFLARDVANNQVLTADVGGANSALFYANNQDFISLVRGNFGLSFGLSNLLAEVGVEAVRRWLPFEATTDEVVHYALNKTLRPQVLPADNRELMIESAYVREALNLMYRELSTESTHELDFNRLVGVGGPLVNVNPWQAALTLLDGIQPSGSKATGLVELELDTTMLMAAAGALATFNPNMATYIFRYDCLHRLGPCIVPLGEATPGTPAVTVTLVTRDGRSRKTTVAYGSLAILPLRVDEQASLEIVPGKNFRIGNTERGTIVRTEPGQEVTGGMVGLIIDARGRPLKLASDPQTRRQEVLNWQKAYAEMLTMAENEAVTHVPPPTRPTHDEPTRQPRRVVEARNREKTLVADSDDLRDALQPDKGKGSKPKKEKPVKIKAEKLPKAKKEKSEKTPPRDGPERIGLIRRK